MDSPRPSPRNKSIRLQRYLASCGLGSRRACEDLIDRGAVTVDGSVISRQGVTVDPAQQEICVHGRPVRPQDRLYLMMNKPRRVLCTASDPRGRPTIHCLLPAFGVRLFTVGRLDGDSEGLLLVTSDGAFCHTLSHPRHCVGKTYRVWTDAPLDSRRLDQARRGVLSRDEVLRVLEIRLAAGGRTDGPCEIVLGEGRNRHIRRLMEALDRRVVRLQRVAIGPLHLGGLPPGAWRRLRAEEIQGLRSAAAGADPAGGTDSRRDRTGKDAATA